jgi:hypothetical protein
MQSIGPGGGGKVSARFLRGRRIQFDGVDLCLAALGCEQGEQAGTGAYIQQPPCLFHRCPGAQQAGIGGDLHGAVGLFDTKFTALEIAVATAGHGCPVGVLPGERA